MQYKLQYIKMIMLKEVLEIELALGHLKDLRFLSQLDFLFKLQTPHFHYLNKFKAYQIQFKF